MVPAGTSTLSSTVAAGSLLERETTAPPFGAGPFSVTVPREEFRPPVTLVGFSVSEAGVGRGEGATARSEEHSLNSSHTVISYAVFCLKKKKKQTSSEYRVQDKRRTWSVS